MKSLLLLALIIPLWSCQKDPSPIENIQISCYQPKESPVYGYIQLENGTIYRKYYFSGVEMHDNITPPKAESYILHFERTDYVYPCDFHVDTYTTDGNILRHQMFCPKKIEGKLIINEVLKP